jgi:hypothetical protein
LKKTIGIAALVAALGVTSAVPAVAGQSNVVPGSVYKGTYVSNGMEYKVRLKTNDSGHGGKFSLKCAGITRERVEIEKGRIKLEFGADEVQVKGRARFKKNNRLKGEVTKVITPGHTCGTGDFEAFVADV